MVAEQLYLFERQNLPMDFEKNLRTHLQGIGVVADYEPRPDQCAVSHVVLRNNEGIEVACGSGKGPYHKVGAIAEAFEHYLLSSSVNGQSRLMQCSEVADQPSFFQDRLLRGLAVDHNGTIQVEAFHKFSSALNPQWVPVAYINPFALRPNANYAEAALRRYSSNSGCAVGSNFHEACLHAFNEIIERHMLSLLYLEFLGFETQIKWSRLDDQRYQHQREQVLDHAADDSELVTLVGESPFKVTTAVSFLIENGKRSFPIPQVGSGASLKPELAVQRSLDEVQQAILLYSDEERREDLRAVQLCQTYPELRPVIEPDKGTFKRFPLVFSLDGPGVQLAVDSQCDLIAGLLESEGYMPLYRVLFERESCATVVQVFVPGMERFHLVRVGTFVAPQRDYERKGEGR